MNLERVTIDGRDFVPDDPDRDAELRHLRSRCELQAGALNIQADRLTRVAEALGTDPPQVPNIYGAANQTNTEPPHSEKLKRRLWPAARTWRLTALIWTCILGVLIGSFATSWNSDAPSVVETVTESVPGETQVEPKPAPIGSQPYTWEAVPNATSYHVVFYDSTGNIVQAHDTPDTVLETELTTGTYQWVVWPTIQGVRQLEATVNATVTIP